jgi:chromate transporter
VKLARHVRRAIPILIALAIFVAVGLLRWPMIPVVLVLTPLSIALERWLGAKKSA